jgi:hypothetical protein
MIFKLRNTQTHQATAVPPGAYSIGREGHNYIQIEDTTVSRTHARIINDEDGIGVEDLGSANGTAVRGQWITERTPLEVGDVVFFGTTSWRLEPEVTSDSDEPSQKGLKPTNPQRVLFRKTTDKLPVNYIRFDDGDAGAEDGPDASLAEEAPAGIPLASRRASPAASPPAAPTGPVAANRLPPAPASPAPSAGASAATTPAPASPIPMRAAEPAAAPPSSPSPSSASLPVPKPASYVPDKDAEPGIQYVVAVPMAVWLALGTGFGLGLLAGALLAWHFFLTR